MSKGRNCLRIHGFVGVSIVLLGGVFLLNEAVGSMEFIQIADDGWRFETARTHQPFVPWGVNYFTVGSDWAPDMWSDEHFRPDKVRQDFKTMGKLGVNVAKVIFPAKRIIKVHKNKVELNRKVLKRFEVMRQAAKQNNIRLIVTLSPGWLGLPTKWFSFTSDRTREILATFWSEFSRKYRNDPLIMGYSLAVEMDIHMWKELEEPWREWLRDTYGDIAALNDAWKSQNKNFDSIAVPGQDGKNSEDWWLHAEGTPENENLTNDPRLYDFQRYRRELARLYIKPQYDALKRAAPKQLVSFGLVQWSAFVRHSGAGDHEGPIGAFPFDPRAIIDVQDYLAPHFYPCYPAADLDTQFRYAQLWLRYCYAGKPLVLEEFNYGADNAGYCRKLVEMTRDDASGWMVWTFQNYPNSDGVTEVCGLIDEAGELTEWGRAFQEMGPEVKSWNLRRRSPTRTIVLPERWLLTSGQYRREIDFLIRNTSHTEAIDFELKR